MSFIFCQKYQFLKNQSLIGPKDKVYTVHAVTTTTVAETSTMRRSNSNGCVMDGPKARPSAPQPQLQHRGQHRSRSNSRNQEEIIHKPRGGGASSSQSDHRSDGGYKSDGWYHNTQRSHQQQPQQKRPDGYRYDFIWKLHWQ